MHAVLLDATGTLIRPREPVGDTYAAVARHFGAELEAEKLSLSFIQVFGDMPDLAFEWTSIDDLRRQERTWWRTLVRRVVESCGTRIIDFEGFFQVLYTHYAQSRAWECFADVPAALDGLHARGFKLAVVSNFDSRLPGILQGLGIGDQLDAILYSSRTGSAKPDPAIFSRALAALRISPDRAIHVGDDAAADVGGAAAAGIAGLLIWRDAAPAVGPGPVIRSLGELLVRLDGGNLPPTPER